jgi:hypothetical protein
MSSKLLDAETILSYNDQWGKLEETWGKPVDLDSEEDMTPSKLRPVFSSLDLRKTTFDSSFLFRKVTKKIGRQLSKKSLLNYNDFLQELQENAREQSSSKQFFYISGQILSAWSVEDICDKIDDIFKSVEKLCSATSTVRLKKKVVPEVIQCSISYGGLSFDDTEENEKEKGDSDDVDQYIDEAFDQLNSTLVSLANGEELGQTKESVSTLVKKFSSILNNPMMRSPRRKRQCSDRFRDLAEFWKNRNCDMED